MPTNQEIIKKYQNEKIIIQTAYQTKDVNGNKVDITGIVNPLYVDNRQIYSVIDDQGSTSQCACYSICGICEALIWKRTGKLINLNAEQVYALAKQRDGSVNEDGTYLEVAIKAAFDLGGFSDQIKNLKIGFVYNNKDLMSLKETIKYLVHKYDFVHAGFNISTGWQYCNINNTVIEHTNRSMGGHAVVITGYDEDGVYIANSWGKSWGAYGFGQLKWEDVGKELMYACYLQNCFDNWHE